MITGEEITKTITTKWREGKMKDKPLVWERDDNGWNWKMSAKISKKDKFSITKDLSTQKFRVTLCIDRFSSGLISEHYETMEDAKQVCVDFLNRIMETEE